jgi:hypothetical protein
VIVTFTRSELREILMDHLVKKGIPSLGVGLIQVPPDVNGWRVGEVTPVFSRSGYANWYGTEDPAEVLNVELIPPSPEHL